MIPLLPLLHASQGLHISHVMFIVYIVTHNKNIQAKLEGIYHSEISKTWRCIWERYYGHDIQSIYIDC